MPAPLLPTPRHCTRLRRLGTLPVVALVAAGCESRSVTAVDVGSIEVAPAEEELVPGQTLRLAATLRDPSGAPLEREVTWTSEHDSVASVDAGGLVEARSSGTTRITASSGGAEGVAVVSVRMPPRIEISEETIEFEATEGDQSAGTREIRIDNGGEGSLDDLSLSVSYESGGGWLETTLEGSRAPTSASVRASPQGLSPGDHRATLRIEAPHAANSPLPVEVVLRVQERPAGIRISPSAAGFLWEQGRAGPPPQTVTVQSDDGSRITGLRSTVRHAGGQPDGWLGAELSDDATPSELSLRVFPQALAPGSYDAVVAVSAQGAGAGAEVRVRLTVAEAPPDPIHVTSIDFATSGFLGRHLHVTLTLQDAGGSPVPDAEVSITIHHLERDESWVRSGTTSANGTVTLDVQNHPSGCYEVTVEEVSAPGTLWDGHTPEHTYCRQWSFFPTWGPDG